MTTNFMTMRTVTILSFLAVSLFYLGCDCDDPRDPDCDNYDPCIGAVQLSSNIQAYHFREHFRGNIVDTLFVNVDTLIDEIPVLFRATGEADNYAWLIGNESFERFGKEVIVDFQDFQGDIDIKLRIWNNMSSQVTPCQTINDTAFMTSRKYRLEDIPDITDQNEGPQAYFGTYKGYYRDDPDTEVEIFIKDGYPDLFQNGPYNFGGIYNFPRDCNNIYREEGGNGLYAIRPLWNSFILIDFPANPGPIFDCTYAGYGKFNSSTKEISIVYWRYILDGSQNVIDSIGYIFSGEKIN